MLKYKLFFMLLYFYTSTAMQEGYNQIESGSPDSPVSDVVFFNSDDGSVGDIEGGRTVELPTYGALGVSKKEGPLVSSNGRVRSLSSRVQHHLLSTKKRGSTSRDLEGMSNAIMTVADTVEASSNVQFKFNKSISRAQII